MQRVPGTEASVRVTTLWTPHEMALSAVGTAAFAVVRGRAAAVEDASCTETIHPQA